MARDPISNETIIWSGRPQRVETPATFRVIGAVLFVTAAIATSFAFVSAWGLGASPFALLMFATWSASLGLAALHGPRIWLSRVEYMVTDEHVGWRRGPFGRTIARKSISYARIFWNSDDPNVGDIELVRAVPTGALRRRLLLRLHGLAAPDKVWALIRGIESRSDSNAGVRCLSQRLEDGERVLWSASPHTTWHRWLPHGKRAWQTFALASTLLVTVAHLGVRVPNNWQLLLEAGLAQHRGALIALALGQAVAILLLLAVTGYLFYNSVLLPARQMAKTKYLITNRRVLIQRDNEELHLDRQQIVDVIDTPAFRGMHNVFLVLDGPRARAVELSGAFGEGERDSHLRPVFRAVDDWESISALLLRRPPSAPPQADAA